MRYNEEDMVQRDENYKTMKIVEKRENSGSVEDRRHAINIQQRLRRRR